MSHMNLWNEESKGTSPLSLSTDLYQLTMAQGYWASGRENDQAIFHLFFRSNPFDGGYAVSAGIGTVLEHLEKWGFSEGDIDYLRSLEGADGNPLFESSFLEWLEALDLSIDLHAPPEGSVVFPHEPLVRVEGPLIQCQLLETLLLNVVNFQTLVATKTARIVDAAEEDPVLEFGLRRAQGPDGGLSASRAAWIGGAAGTSNVLAGKTFDIPVKGTHAHSWVQSFDTETDAFDAWAETSPNNGVFLVDTYDTLEGVRKAVESGRRLRERGHDLVGVRLDSGDLAWLSKQSREILDEAGFEDAKIVASNSLDERVVASLKAQDAKIDMWGVGTNLVTAKDQPALGGVYKLAAVKPEGEDWSRRIKLSEQRIKISIPGRLQILRWGTDDEYRADMIVDKLDGSETYGDHIVDPMDDTRRRRFQSGEHGTELLIPMVKDGKRVNTTELGDARTTANKDLNRLPTAVRRFENPHEYPVGMDPELAETRRELVLQARGFK